MATLVLQAAGSAVGGALGGPLGAAIGGSLGTVAALALGAGQGGGGAARVLEGPRLKDLDGISATEGAPIPRLYGRARLGGQIIWATRLEEEVITTTSSAGNRRRGGKSVARGIATPAGGGGGASTRGTTTEVEYRYYANIAVALCEGPIAFVRRIWADGALLDTSRLAMRVHRGDDTQQPDPLIVAKQGGGPVPAYRGTAYVVFERLPLAAFGNRVPQLSFEVVRPVHGLGHMLRAVNLIPGAGEFAYETVKVTQTLGLDASRPENRHQTTHDTDWSASLDALQALCPNLASVALVVAWFGDDLRADACTITPRVEITDKTTVGAEWAVGDLTRASARTVSSVAGRPAYGGTPSDAGVIRAITDLKARGLAVVLYPFVMMDVPAGNALPDPWTGAASQPPYPWRGRITCHPAPGRAGSPDGTAAAGAAVAALFGSVTPAAFPQVAGAAPYAGPAEWGLRRLVLHTAALARAAGGVHGFILLSELASLTRLRDGAGQYPATAALMALAADVRAMLGPGTQLGYAADWTEYGSHVTEGGAGLRFPLDPLFAHPAIDFVGIDWYPPVSDRRDGEDHADAALAVHAADPAYLRGRLAAGEAFDWYYASPADRAAQQRTPISDGAYGRPWVYRAKDLVSWWSEPHVERFAGVEAGAPTPWVPRSKPIWLVEIGCPAVDKGPNGPNVFPDPKSAESALPPFSSGERDDLVALRLLEATLGRFDPAVPGFEEGFNPVSPLYGGRMVEPSRIFAWAWDARPYPAFPALADVWSDGANWHTGHWLTGRLEGVALDWLVAAMLADAGLPAANIGPLRGFLEGYCIDRPMSPRAALEPLLSLFDVEAAAIGGQLMLRDAPRASVLTLAADDLVQERRRGGEAPVLSVERAFESELPAQVSIAFTDGEGDYRRAMASARHPVAGTLRELALDTGAVLRRAVAEQAADRLLHAAWTGREQARFTLPPSALALVPGDVVTLIHDGAERPFRITAVTDRGAREVVARAVHHRGAAPRRDAGPAPALPAPRFAGPAMAVVLDLPIAMGADPVLQWLAVSAEPWTAGYALWKQVGSGSFEPVANVGARATIGTTLEPLPPGPLWRWQHGASLRVRLAHGSLASVEPGLVLEGANALALLAADGHVEVLGFAEATLVAPGTFRLSRLLRGLAGSEAAAARTLPAGSRLVLLDRALLPLASGPESLGRPQTFRLAPAESDHADPFAITLDATPGALALLPLAPVHLRARRTPAGIALRWVRRARYGGDGWETAEVPLAEEREAYRVEILSASQVLRSLDAATPEALYGAAQELADFGSAQTTLHWRVRQLSTLAGDGHAAMATSTVG
jgi:hypothetical protein